MLLVVIVNSAGWSQNGNNAPPPSVPIQPSPAVKNPAKPESTRDNLLDDMNKQLKKELSDNNTDNTDKPERKKPSWLWQITKTTLALAFMLGIFFAGYKLFLFKRALPAQTSSVIKSWYDYPLQPGKNLRIVEMNNRLMLLALSEAGIQLLTEITDKDQVERIKLDCEKDNSVGRPDFLSELTNSIKDRFNTKKQTGQNFSNVDENPELSQLREATRQRLKGLKQDKDQLRRLDDNSWES